MYSKLSTSVDPTDFGITSVLQTEAYRLAQENIDLNVLSVTTTDMTCAPANCHYGRICEDVALPS